MIIKAKQIGANDITHVVKGVNQLIGAKRLNDIEIANANPNMKIMLCGGVFGRAEGLWEEIGADLYAETPSEAVETASREEPIIEPVRTINRRKRKYQQMAENAAEEK